jgi:uncharacterized protein (TIGR00266 family)
MLTGQNVFLTDFECTDKPGTVALGTDFPSKILRLDLQDMPEQSLICQRGAFLASNPSVEISMELTKSLSAGFFGGQGFVLQRLSGEGDVLVKAGGTLVTKDLNPGERLRVTSGSIVAFQTTIDYDVQMMPGIKNAMFGGEGLFVTTLTGPGRVWLQGMPPDRMIAEIARRVPGKGLGFPIPIGMGGMGGSSGGEAAEDAGGEESGEEMVAATDASVDADRQATVASSGLGDAGADDSSSPGALFGDAAAPESAENATDATFGDDFSSTTTSEPSFADTSFSSSEETSFDDGSFSSEDFDSGDFNDGEIFDDGTASDMAEQASGLAEQASEQGSSILSTLWSMFTDDD